MPNNIFVAMSAALISLGLTACTASSENAEEAAAINTDKFGHLSAIYLCGDEQLQTSHDDMVTQIAFKGSKIDAERTVQILDGAFTGETFTGMYEGDLFVFKGKGYDASLTINDDVVQCEKLSCIPLGDVH